MRRLIYLVCGLLLSAMLSHSACALDHVTLQLKWTHAFQFAGYYAAQEQGYYRDAGLQVDITEAAPNIDPIQEVISGKAQYGVGTSSLLLQRAAGKPLIVLAVVFQQSPYVIFTAPNIYHLHDLVGKRIMLEPQADELIAYLRKEGLSQKDFQQLPHSFDAQGLMDGKAEAISGYVSNEPYYFLRTQYPYHTFSPRSAGIDFYGDNLFTTENELHDHPARLKAFRAASMRGWQYAKEHRDEIIALILSKYSSQHSRDYLEFESDQMLPLLQPDLIEIGYMNPSRWQHIANTYAEIGLLPHNFPLQGFLYDAGAQDLSRLYRALTFALLAIAIIAAVAVYIHRINLKLQASEKKYLATQTSLLHAKEVAEQTLAEQRQFIAMVSHEFRSPLGVIDSAVQLLSIRLQAEPDTSHIMARIRRGVSRLTNFLDNCLTEDRLDSTGLTLQPSPIDLYELAATAKDSAQHISGRHHIITELDENLPLLNADPQLLLILLLNLLGNAIKYSPEGTEIKLRIRQIGQSCRFEVIDQGQGIPAEELPLVFKKYQRGRASGGVPGAGLGLSLVSRISELHAAQIEIKSRENEGTHVTLTFPLN